MILTVYRDKYFDERIRRFFAHGGTAALAAKKAEEIINRIVQYGRDNNYQVGRQSRNGELRIRNCVKYDLGNGYRMVCLMREHRFVALYIGTHDECARWIERNKGLQYDINDARPAELKVKEYVPRIPSNEHDPTDAYEEELLQRLDDEILRKIFWGICRRASNHVIES